MTVSERAEGALGATVEETGWVGGVDMK